MTASMVKGATAGNLIADAIKKAVEWTKSWTIEAAKMAAHELRMAASGRAWLRRTDHGRSLREVRGSRPKDRLPR